MIKRYPLSYFAARRRRRMQRMLAGAGRILMREITKNGGFNPGGPCPAGCVEIELRLHDALAARLLELGG